MMITIGGKTIIGHTLGNDEKTFANSELGSVKPCTNDAPTIQTQMIKIMRVDFFIVVSTPQYN